MDDTKIYDRITCVFSTDDNYCQHLSVALVSLLENNKSNNLSLYIIHSNVKMDNLASLSLLLDSYPGLLVTFCEFDATDYSHFRLDEHITLASYFRLFLTQILPAHVTRLIFLDCDIVVLDDLRALWRFDLGEKLIGAVPDYFMSENSRLNLPEDYRYFNAGVLLIDLAGWRANNLMPLFVDYVERSSAFLRYHDQDTLNVILQNRVKYLDLKWNLQPRLSPKDAVRVGLSPDAYLMLRQAPKIVHFTTARKPWFYRFDVPFEDRYRFYLQKTPWKHYVPPDRTMRTMTWRFIKRHLPGLAGALKLTFQQLG